MGMPGLFLPWLAMAFLTVLLASKQGRNPFIALLLGLAFPFIAAIGYVVVGKTLEKQAEDHKKLQEFMDE